MPIAILFYEPMIIPLWMSLAMAISILYGVIGGLVFTVKAIRNKHQREKYIKKATRAIAILLFAVYVVMPIYIELAQKALYFK